MIRWQAFIALSLAFLVIDRDLPADELGLAARHALKENCLPCHKGEGSVGGNFHILRTADLTAADGSWTAPLVVPREAGKSQLMERISSGEMPPATAPRKLTSEEKKAIEDWIAAGAAAFVETEDRRKFVTNEQVLQAVAKHLNAVAKADKQFQRYFTLHCVSNHPLVVNGDLPTFRAALSKALNSLHELPWVFEPKAVDDAQLVYAVDLRDLAWNEAKWNEVARLYPYGVHFAENQETEHELEEGIIAATRTQAPVMRADWLVATATRPPLYHTLLDLPKNARELERKLNVNIAANFRDPAPDRIARAAFAKSGVSGQNRLVERNRASFGYYWKSYDFKPDTGRAKLTRFPLGPLNLFPGEEHPFANQAFVHDGGEIIFGLPNGLQAYLLVDGKDERIDAGPIEVVSDALKTSGTPAIVNGVSCMSCHKHGTISFTDGLRGGSAVFGAAEVHVRKLYPPQATWNELLAADEKRFLEALETAVGPFFRVGDKKNLPLKNFPEPIGEVARWHRLEFLDLRVIAAELGIENPQDIVRKVGEKRMKQLGLEALLQDRGVVNRFEWEAFNGISLMQELARELGYTPFRTL